MDFEIDLSNLPASSQEAFTVFEAAVRAEYETLARNDRDHNVDQNGNYEGTYAPERAYVTAIIAFLDEYSLEVDIEDISAISDSEFELAFRKFRSQVMYVATRYKLRKNRID